MNGLPNIPNCADDETISKAIDTPTPKKTTQETNKQHSIMSKDKPEEEYDKEGTKSLHTECSLQEPCELPDSSNKDYLGDKNNDMEAEALLSEFEKEE